MINSGKWLLIVDSPIGKIKATLNLEMKENVLVGTISTQLDISTPLSEIKHSNNEFNFSATVNSPMGGVVKIETRLTKDSEGFTGIVRSPYGSFPAVLTENK